MFLLALAAITGRAVRIDRSRPFLHYKYGLLLKQYDRKKEAEEAIRATLQEAQLGTEVPTRVIEARSVEKGLEEEGDLLIVGSSIDRLLGQWKRVLAGHVSVLDEKDVAIGEP